MRCGCCVAVICYADDVAKSSQRSFSVHLRPQPDAVAAIVAGIQHVFWLKRNSNVGFVGIATFSPPWRGFRPRYSPFDQMLPHNSSITRWQELSFRDIHFSSNFGSACFKNHPLRFFAWSRSFVSRTSSMPNRIYPKSNWSILTTIAGTRCRNRLSQATETGPSSQFKMAHPTERAQLLFAI